MRANRSTGLLTWSVPGEWVCGGLVLLIGVVVRWVWCILLVFLCGSKSGIRGRVV